MQIYWIITDDIVLERTEVFGEAIYGFLWLKINTHTVGLVPKGPLKPNQMGFEDILFFMQQMKEKVLTLKNNESAEIFLIQSNLIDLTFSLKDDSIYISQRRKSIGKSGYGTAEIEWTEKLDFDEVKSSISYSLQKFVQELSLANKDLLNTNGVKMLIN